MGIASLSVSHRCEFNFSWNSVRRMRAAAFFLLLLGFVYGEEWKKYHSHEELEDKLVQINKKCPDYTRLYSLGQSVEGRELAVIHISSTPGEHVALKPEVKYVGNMHGNEPVGRELLLRLAETLCDGIVNKDKDVMQLINSTSIHILPTMNPDGFELALNTNPKDRAWLTGRSNANGVDLNRDFPNLDEAFFELAKAGVNKFDHLMDLFEDDQERQPETLAVGKWILSLPFVLSANLHEGDLVANYPFDSSTREGESSYSASPDDKTFRWLAQVYANNHAHMAKNDHPPCDGTSQDAFARQGGITNGAKWYSVSGGMQDFNYLGTNAMEITLELSCEKMPSGESLPQLWDDNKKSLMEYMWSSHAGIKGLITDASNGEPVQDAVIWVNNGTVTIKHPVTSGVYGDYYRILPAGQYEIVVVAEGFEPVGRNVTVTNKVRDSALVVDFSMKPTMVEENQVQDGEPLTKEQEIQMAEILEAIQAEQAANQINQ